MNLDRYNLFIEDKPNLTETKERIDYGLFFYFLITIIGLFSFWSLI